MEKNFNIELLTENLKILSKRIYLQKQDYLKVPKLNQTPSDSDREICEILDEVDLWLVQSHSGLQLFFSQHQYQRHFHNYALDFGLSCENERP